MNEKIFVDIYNKIFSKEDYEVCMKYLSTMYNPILRLVEQSDKSEILNEIIEFENENYKKISNNFDEEMKKYNNAKPEKVISFYSTLAFTLAIFKKNNNKNYLLGEYCKKAFNEILNDKNYADTIKNNRKLVSETILDFSFAAGGNNMSFRIRETY